MRPLVGIDITPLQTGHRLRGIGSYARGLLAGFDELGVGEQLLLYAFSGIPIDPPTEKIPAGVEVCLLPYQRGLGRAAALATQQFLMLPQAIASRPHLFHHLGLVASPDVGGLPWHMVRRSIVTIHDLIPLQTPGAFLGKRLRWVYYRAMLAAAQRARRVITVSQASAEEITRRLRLPSNRVVVIPNAVDKGLAALLREEAPARTIADLPARYILTVGGDHVNKRLDLLLRALTTLPRDTGLVVVGRGGATFLRFRESHPHDAARVTFRAELDARRLAEVYRRASVVVVASDHEGFGLPVLEAMTAGVPVVSSDDPALLEVAGGAAFTFVRGDAQALGRAIREALEPSYRRDELIQRGLLRTRDFSWKRTAQMTMEVYHEAMGARSADRSRGSL